ncbi:Hypothetical predicted protein [Lecanosticta acicola]|uniref:Uncharacterized protein n=1 Tax=Lecanosticta acicola TaxID=111012 RepID=A0AAI9EDZ3_9PEZI|nr:Hypothetical predicted protein [Lecanosticta acicola]
MCSVGFRHHYLPKAGQAPAEKKEQDTTNDLQTPWLSEDDGKLCDSARREECRRGAMNAARKMNESLRALKAKYPAEEKTPPATPSATTPPALSHATTPDDTPTSSDDERVASSSLAIKKPNVGDLPSLAGSLISEKEVAEEKVASLRSRFAGVDRYGSDQRALL